MAEQNPGRFPKKSQSPSPFKGSGRNKHQFHPTQNQATIPEWKGHHTQNFMRWKEPSGPSNLLRSNPSSSGGEEQSAEATGALLSWEQRTTTSHFTPPKPVTSTLRNPQHTLRASPIQRYPGNINMGQKKSVPVEETFIAPSPESRNSTIEGYLSLPLPPREPERPNPTFQTTQERYYYFGIDKKAKLLARTTVGSWTWPILGQGPEHCVFAKKRTFPINGHPAKSILEAGLADDVAKVVNRIIPDVESWKFNCIRIGFQEAPERNPVVMLICIMSGSVGRELAQTLANEVQIEFIK